MPRRPRSAPPRISYAVSRLRFVMVGRRIDRVVWIDPEKSKDVSQHVVGGKGLEKALEMCGITPTVHG